MSRLIVFEGLDGAGTTTQAQRLAVYLKGRRIPVHLTREPSDHPIGRLLREFLQGRHGLDGQPVDPATLALLFTADRMDHLQREVEPQLASGQIVVSDRWYHSSLAYQSDAGSDLDWIATLNERARRPDLTIFLRVDPEVAAQRRIFAGRAQELFDDVQTQRRVHERYSQAIEYVRTRLGERVEVLDGELTVEDLGVQVETLANGLIATLAFRYDFAGRAVCGVCSHTAGQHQNFIGSSVGSSHAWRRTCAARVREGEPYCTCTLLSSEVEAACARDAVTP